MNIMQMSGAEGFAGAWTVLDSPNKKLAVTIKDIKTEDVVGNDGRKERLTVIHFVEPIEPFIINKTNKKRLCLLHGTTETDKLIGKRFYLTTERVKAFGAVHDALRIVPNEIPKSEGDKVIACETCGKPIEPAYGMSAADFARYAKSKLGKAICSECAEKIKKTNDENKGE